MSFEAARAIAVWIGVGAALLFVVVMLVPAAGWLFGPKDEPW